MHLTNNLKIFVENIDDFYVIFWYACLIRCMWYKCWIYRI